MTLKLANIQDCLDKDTRNKLLKAIPKEPLNTSVILAENLNTIGHKKYLWKFWYENKCDTYAHNYHASVIPVKLNLSLYSYSSNSSNINSSKVINTELHRIEFRNAYMAKEFLEHMTWDD